MLTQIEEEVDISRITHKGHSIWPVIKSYLPGITGEFNIIKEATPANVKTLLKNLLPDLLSIRFIKRQPYWVFTNSERRYYINDTSFDRITTGLLHYIPGYVLFENPVPKGKTAASKLQSGEYYVGLSWIFLLQYLTMKLSPQPKIRNLELLEQFLDKDLSKLRKIYARILAGEKVYRFLFKLLKPKAIFLVCYYSNFEVLMAAKHLDIPVVELQHGLVTEGHRAYFFKNKQSGIFLPDYFLSYGSHSADLVARGNILPRERILNYGYSFLEAVSARLSMSPELKEVKRKFPTTICITGQLPVTDIPLLNMIRNVSGQFPNVGFIFKPRYPDRDNPFVPTSNFISMPDVNTYELLKYCDYHLTVYSTCAMESLALGTPTISVDIKGYYTRYLKELLSGNPFNKELYTQEELVHFLKNRNAIPIESEVQASISHIFSPMADKAVFHSFMKKSIPSD